jgi:transposase-like protein
MPRKGRTNEEIIHALHQVEGGEKVTEVCRRLGVSEQTFYRWKKQFMEFPGFSGDGSIRLLAEERCQSPNIRFLGEYARPTNSSKHIAISTASR